MPSIFYLSLHLPRLLNTLLQVPRRHQPNHIHSSKPTFGQFRAGSWGLRCCRNRHRHNWNCCLSLTTSNLLSEDNLISYNEVIKTCQKRWIQCHVNSGCGNTQPRIHLLWQSVITLCFYLVTPNPHMLHTPRLWFRPAMCNKPSHLWNPVGGCRWWRTLSTLGGLGVPHSQRDPVGRPQQCRSSLQINTSENFVLTYCRCPCGTIQ